MQRAYHVPIGFCAHVTERRCPCSVRKGMRILLSHLDRHSVCMDACIQLHSAVMCACCTHARLCSVLATGKVMPMLVGGLAATLACGHDGHRCAAGHAEQSGLETTSMTTMTIDAPDWFSLRSSASYGHSRLQQQPMASANSRRVACQF